MHVSISGATCNRTTILSTDFNLNIQIFLFYLFMMYLVMFQFAEEVWIVSLSAYGGGQIL